MIDILGAASLIAKGQQRQAEIISTMLETGKIPSSLLFTGPEGSGKELAAFSLASRLNCLAPDRCPAERCPACLKAGRLEYPDLHLVYPLPSGPVEKTLPVIIESRRENFFEKGEFGSKARSIGIDIIRMLVETLSKHPFEGKYSPVILFEAHMATIEAQNAFLKLLEEPPSSAVLILVTEFPERLLPTILSRCQEIRFDHLPESTTAKFLEKFYSVEKKEAGELALRAGGNLRRGTDFLDERFLRLRNDAVQALKLVIEGKARQIPGEAEVMADEYTREETAALLKEMTSLLRQVLLFNAGALPPREAVALGKELGKDLIDIAAGRDISADIRKVNLASQGLRRNIDVELMWDQLLLDLAGKWY
ncbi:MAG: DNA polymerase III subunit [Candidatus Krumholzibacteriota bacterium]|nr:DNA polymerase III subunit [Candidatus Krumholzibacteriota bacterium]